MNDDLGLRERKKAATRRELRGAAIKLFSRRGFDNVSVAEVAAEVGVSTKTVFNYFPTKEDLVAGFEDLAAEPAARVRDRGPGQTPLEAIFEGFRHDLAARLPAVGMSDNPSVLRLLRLIMETPALSNRWQRHFNTTITLLTDQLESEGIERWTARVVAAQILTVQLELIKVNQRRLLDGATSDEVYPAAVARAEHAFELLRSGLGDLLRRNE